MREICDVLKSCYILLIISNILTILLMFCKSNICNIHIYFKWFFFQMVTGKNNQKKNVNEKKKEKQEKKPGYWLLVIPYLVRLWQKTHWVQCIKNVFSSLRIEPFNCIKMNVLFLSASNTFSLICTLNTTRHAMLITLFWWGGIFWRGNTVHYSGMNTAVSCWSTVCTLDLLVLMLCVL